MAGRIELSLAIAVALVGASAALAQRVDGQLPGLPPVVVPGVPQLPKVPQLPGVPQLPVVPQLPGLPGVPTGPTLPNIPTPIRPGSDPAAGVRETLDRTLPETGSPAVDAPIVRRRLFDATRWLDAAPAASPALTAIPTADGGVAIGAAPAPTETGPAQTARTLTPEQRARLDQLLAAGNGRIVLDDLGEAARAGEVVLNDPDDATLAVLTARGFRVLERSTIEGLGVGFARLAVPPDATLADALRAARMVSRDVSSDVLHFASGAGVAPAAAGQAATPRVPVTVGMIDGGVGVGVGGRLVQRGFAQGAPRASDHGTAVASLIAGGGRGRVAGAAPGATIVAADVFGADPAGGTALAIAKALGWLAASRVAVVTISLVGPANLLLARTVAAAQARGMVIVAPVGNDGPASAPVYPASYSGVVAVTGVDARGRVLIEAGRAGHLDYAAPGADLLAIGGGGGVMRVRGTSFAAPFVAATIARAQARTGNWRATVDAGARDLGAKGVDPVYGRGLVCGDCATRR